MWFSKASFLKDCMKKQPPSTIFRDHPALQDGEEEATLPHLSNAMVLTNWLRTAKPGLRELKVAAIVEATNSCRPNILDRLLGRIFKVERQQALESLINLKNE